jgi:hypothetical protein
VWLAWERRYQVELWDAAGRQHLVLERALDWFTPWDAGGTPAGNPPGFGPRITSVHEDPRGRVWVVVQRTIEVDSSNPRDRPSPKKSENLIEVLDPATGQLVVSNRTVGGFTHLRDDLVARYQETPEGYTYIELFRLVLTER